MSRKLVHKDQISKKIPKSVQMINLVPTDYNQCSLTKIGAHRPNLYLRTKKKKKKKNNSAQYQKEKLVINYKKNYQYSMVRRKKKLVYNDHTCQSMNNVLEHNLGSHD